MNSQQQRILPSRRYQFFFAGISIFLRRDIDFSSPRYRFFLRGDINFFFARYRFFFAERYGIFLRGDIDFFFARLRCLCPSWLRPLIASKEIKNYSLACDVNALVAATANREQETKNYSLAGYVYALVGRDRRWRAGK